MRGAYSSKAAVKQQTDGSWFRVRYTYAALLMLLYCCFTAALLLQADGSLFWVRYGIEREREGERCLENEDWQAAALLLLYCYFTAACFIVPPLYCCVTAAG